jgi:WD40 repeat protein
VGAAFGPDGTTVVTLSVQRSHVFGSESVRLTVTARRIPSGEVIRKLTFENHSRISALSPRGTYCYEPGRANVVEAATGEACEQLKDLPSILAFSPDERVVVTLAGTKDTAKLRVWDVRTGKPLTESYRVPEHQQLFDLFWLNAPNGAGEPIGPNLWDGGPLRFSPDGEMFVFAERLWDVSTGRPCSPRLFAKRAPANDIAFTADAGAVVFAKNHGVEIWQLPAPVPDEGERVARWLEIALRKQLEEGGELVPLDAVAWRAKFARLKELGGAP